MMITIVLRLIMMRFSRDGRSLFMISVSHTPTLLICCNLKRRQNRPPAKQPALSALLLAATSSERRRRRRRRRSTQLALAWLLSCLGLPACLRSAGTAAAAVAATAGYPAARVGRDKCSPSELYHSSDAQGPRTETHSPRARARRWAAGQSKHYGQRFCCGIGSICTATIRPLAQPRLSPTHNRRIQPRGLAIAKIVAVRPSLPHPLRWTSGKIRTAM